MEETMFQNTFWCNYSKIYTLKWHCWHCADPAVNIPPLYCQSAPRIIPFIWIHFHLCCFSIPQITSTWHLLGLSSHLAVRLQAELSWDQQRSVFVSCDDNDRLLASRTALWRSVWAKWACHSISPQESTHARDLMAYGDVYCAPMRAKHYLRQPWLNITVTALLCLVGLALSITAENGNVWNLRMSLSSKGNPLWHV